jgi:hypothetical protein
MGSGAPDIAYTSSASLYTIALPRVSATLVINSITQCTCHLLQTEERSIGKHTRTPRKAVSQTCDTVSRHHSRLNACVCRLLFSAIMWNCLTHQPSRLVLITESEWQCSHNTMHCDALTNTTHLSGVSVMVCNKNQLFNHARGDGLRGRFGALRRQRARMTRNFTSFDYSSRILVSAQ